MLMVWVGLVMSTACWSQDRAIYKGQKGNITFISEAPLELIKAKSDRFEGVLDGLTGRFAFKVSINSFEGFNSPLQRIHFQENYLESGEFPDALFEGKIIDEYDFTTNGTYSIRAKGAFTVHGVTKERIIRVQLTVDDQGIVIQTEFLIRLEDHNIRVPRIVYQKIAEEIDISLRIELQ